MIAAGLAAAAAPAGAQTIDQGVIYRVFLHDGRALPSYGEYALTADRIVFVLPIGDPAAKVDLQLISLPLTAVDLARTTRYTESMRARRYADTRGAVEYSAMSAQVTVALAEIEKEPDPKRRLSMAEEARTRLLEWPGAHFGYRAQEVRELAGLFDDVIAELRAAAGESRFTLALMAGAPIRDLDRPLPPLSLRDSIALALAAASVSDVSTDRSAILQMAFARASEGAADELVNIAARLDAERAADAAYTRLTAELTARADAAMRRGDVAGVSAARAQLADRDRALGGLRPQAVDLLAKQLDDMLERAQQFRLTLDHWHAVRPALLRYERRIRPVLVAADALTRALEEIRDLRGPDFRRLVQATVRVKGLSSDIESVTPPRDLEAAHATLRSALFMARQACERRAQAIAGPNLSVARDAAAAAAGTLLLLAHAREDLVSHLLPPRFQ